ncbi:heat shock factor protein 1 isoform 2-T2 [Amazona ochrocephala]
MFDLSCLHLASSGCGQSGSSFHVFDQGQFAKEVLPKYFKHNNMASFVRQLNMYGFRKVVHIEQGGLVKPEKDDTEFQHPYFIRGQEHLLENIKRKVTSVSSLKNEDIKVQQDNVTKLLTDIQVMKGKQESMDSKLIAMKHENEALWREVASLRQKHAQQQKVVNKLIQFLISLVQSNRILGVKRKIPLMLNDGSSAHSMPKYSRQYSLEHVHGSSPYAASSPAYSGSNLYSPDSSANSGPIISDVTELAQSSPSASPSGSLDGRSSPAVRIKEEPPSPSRSPQVEEASPGKPPAVETPLFPSAFIDSFLQEGDPSATAAGSDSPTQPQKCLSVACLDKNELNDHLDTIDSNLDNLQTMLTTHGFSVDTSALLDVSLLSWVGWDGAPELIWCGPCRERGLLRLDRVGISSWISNWTGWTSPAGSPVGLVGHLQLDLQWDWLDISSWISNGIGWTSPAGSPMGLVGHLQLDRQWDWLDISNWISNGIGWTSPTGSPAGLVEHLQLDLQWDWLDISSWISSGIGWTSPTGSSMGLVGHLQLDLQWDWLDMSHWIFSWIGWTSPTGSPVGLVGHLQLDLQWDQLDISNGISSWIGWTSPTGSPAGLVGHLQLDLNGIGWTSLTGSPMGLVGHL